MVAILFPALWGIFRRDARCSGWKIMPPGPGNAGPCEAFLGDAPKSAHRHQSSQALRVIPMHRFNTLMMTFRPSVISTREAAARAASVALDTAMPTFGNRWHGHSPSAPHRRGGGMVTIGETSRNMKKRGYDRHFYGPGIGKLATCTARWSRTYTYTYLYPSGIISFATRTRPCENFWAVPRRPIDNSNDGKRCPAAVRNHRSNV